MKKLKLALILMVTILLFSCEKDEQGRILKYYKHVTGKGHVFYKYLDGTISPCTMEVTVSASVYDNVGMGGINPGTSQPVKTDVNGGYSCRFVKKADGWDMNYYNLEVIPFNVHFSFLSRWINGNIVREAAAKASKKNPQIIQIDTIWLVQRIIP
jgi:hypothetical protein